MRLGALEAGGTKMVCAIGNEHGEIEKQISLPTETPKITLPKLADFSGKTKSRHWESDALARWI